MAERSPTPVQAIASSKPAIRPSVTFPRRIRGWRFWSPRQGIHGANSKGHASYWSLNVDGRRSVNVAWSYPAPSHGFREIGGYPAFYASCVDECWVDDETRAAARRRFLWRLDYLPYRWPIQGRRRYEWVVDHWSRRLTGVGSLQLEGSSFWPVGANVCAALTEVICQRQKSNEIVWAVEPCVLHSRFFCCRTPSAIELAVAGGGKRDRLAHNSFALVRCGAGKPSTA
jgi:hypothetical protein